MTPDGTTNGARKRRGRPFPWRCFNCLKEEIYPATVPYAADIKHDGRLHHIEVPDLTIPKCRACGEVVFNYEADDRMMAALRARLNLLTPEQIREGQKKLGLRSKELARRLGVAAATVSRWEKKMMIQSRAMDNLLRVYFAVPQVREVLRGPNQDAGLGTSAVLSVKLPRPTARRTAATSAGKFARLTSLALRYVRSGSTPDCAWLMALESVYSGEQLSSQVKHTCPKWAFCILCHAGHVKKVSPGCCPESVDSSSAAYTLKALSELAACPALATNKKELKRKVFGEKGEPGYRTPNDEVEVLLSLWEAGEIEHRERV